MSINVATGSLRALSLSCSASSSRSFTSSAAVLAGKGAKKSSVRQAGKKTRKTASANKKVKAISGPLTMGIRLSYALAVPPPDLSDVTVYSSDVVTAKNIGTPTVFSKQALDSFETYGFPRRMEREVKTPGGPATVIRQITVDLKSKMSAERASSSKDSRYMLTGDIGSGKSALLAQSVAHALSSGWIVIYAPKALSWTDASTPFGYNPETQIFDQPALAKQMLDSIASVNSAKLKEIQVEGENGKNLLAFIQKATLKEKTAPQSLSKVFEILAEQTKSPVLLAVDEVNALFTTSVYRTPKFELLEAYHLSTPLLALDYLSGRKTFNRGMTLSAYSHSAPNLLISDSFAYPLELPTPKPITPYSKFDQIHLAHASSGFKKIEVPFGMSTKEATGMFQIYAKKGWLRQESDENFMGAFLSAAGNPKELGREWLNDKKAYERFDPNINL